jgi:predicted DCC family thiol-disulfide oxidoreductase YuxK
MTEAAQGWVFYDGDCPLCIGAAARFAPMLRHHHFDLAPLPAVWVRQRAGLEPEEPLAEMKLLAADGWIYGGADALVQIARRIWWAWPLFALAQIPGTMILFRAIYRRVAANRNCMNGDSRHLCNVKEKIKTTAGRRLGYNAINAVIIYLLIVYAWAAWKGGQP